VTLTLPLLAAPLLGLAAVALDRHLRAVRTRRQVVEVLAALPEMAGAASAADVDRIAASVQLARMAQERPTRV
jgi:hypothetical protein